MTHERILLDSNAWSDLMRGDREVSTLIRESRRVLMSAIVVGELEYGFRRGTRAERNQQLLDDFMDAPVVRFLIVTRTTADRFGRVMARLRERGQPIPTNDVWIAAHALETGATLVTRDKHFERVDGLAVEWLDRKSPR
jgi:tRNA(fMet)-specific endonuclease VapC